MEIAHLLVRPAKEDDIKAISAIEAECIPDPWSEKAIKYDLVENRNARYVVGEIDNVIIGFVGYWVIDYEGEINNVAVTPDVRGSGIGTILVRDTLARMESSGVETVSLEVRKSNYSAINMYKKLGFQDVSVRKSYYRDNNEDAIIMRRIGNPERDLQPGSES